MIKFRESKEKTYKSQIEREEIYKSFMEYNFHLAKTNAFNNLKNQNVHSSRHINQYYNDYYYEMIEREEEDIENRHNRNTIDNLLGKTLMLMF